MVNDEKLDKAFNTLQILNFGHPISTNADYTKFDYQKETGLSDIEVKKMHTCAAKKIKSVLPIPGKKDPLMGLQFDMGEDKSLILTGMKLMSPFRNTTLEVGWTIFAINGVTKFESVEVAEEVVKKEEDKVSIVAGWVRDGVLFEYTGKDEFLQNNPKLNS